MTNMVFGPPQCSIQVILYIYQRLYLEIMAKELKANYPLKLVKLLNLQMSSSKTPEEILQFD